MWSWLLFLPRQYDILFGFLLAYGAGLYRLWTTMDEMEVLEFQMTSIPRGVMQQAILEVIGAGHGDLRLEMQCSIAPSEVRADPTDLLPSRLLSYDDEELVLRYSLLIH